MPSTFGIVDLFAGPGGLGEGFASLETGGHTPFHLGISVEKEISAHSTLRLRSFLRAYRREHGRLPEEYIGFHAGQHGAPDWSELAPQIFDRANQEARCLELGTAVATEAIDQSIAALRAFDDTVLIGGPPCQAYSLVGRARSRGKEGYVPEEDHRHYLFREYIGVLDRLRPAAFVMENVKGMLSSSVESRLVFEMLMEDLASVGRGRGHVYELFAVHQDAGSASLVPVTRPSDFVVCAERFGVPQRRHRVIIIGVRSDMAAGATTARISTPTGTATVEGVIGNLTPLRSGISRSKSDTFIDWRQAVADAVDLLMMHSDDLREELSTVRHNLDAIGELERQSANLPNAYGGSNETVLQWIERPGMRVVAQHETRSHMVSDLGRYLFSAAFGRVHGFSPKAGDFPDLLRPNHRNWDSGIFNDRFRVQLAGEPSTTITSHIAKDGHYFIHPDPVQCRSLTLREAARLQTFPDDYLFLGNRTQQYVQVGNAVPPFLARQLAELLHKALIG